MKKIGLLIAIVGLLIFFGNKPEVQAADLYLNYQELSAAKIIGTDYKIVNRKTASSTAVIAIHGGSIEPGTSELADNIAGTNHDFYSFYGIMSSNNTSLHITSTNFNEPIALDLVQKSRNTLSIHGFSSTSNLTYIGGLDKTLVAKVKTKLKAAGFVVADAPINLAGLETTNITNRNLRKAGVQIEISSSLRASFFSSLTTAGRETKTTQFYKYTNAIRAALSY
ncbi:MAG: phage replication protein [Fusobacteria bacterium]|nr:MAG: phage replication protein [Fusobacteriota bacterium]KAF0228769.1 MAG: phage replication [Fusobacteriota bacterium]